MIFERYYLGCLAHASYLVGDAAAGVAAVIDPQRDVEQYLAAARRLGVRITHAVLTHFHADFVAGHLELRDRAGARIALGAAASAEYDFLRLRDGDEIALGGVTLRALETPGHTPEGICLLVLDGGTDTGARPAPPYAVLTGDTLFLGDVGRPDLMASAGLGADDLAGRLYDSLRAKILPLPDDVLVYPAHGAGSACGRSLSGDACSTLGVQRRYNYALQPMSKEEFVRLVTADQPEAPRYFAHDALANRRERPTLERALERALRPLGLDQALALRDAGAQILDVRDPADYLGAHLAGCVHVGLSGRFASWAGTVLDARAPVVLLADPGREEEAALRLGRIGLDQVAGYVEGGMAALAGRDDLLRRTERVAAATLAGRLAGAAPPCVLDVRTADERAAGAIAGSAHVSLAALATRPHDVPDGRPLVVHCASGYRSAIACSVLERAGVAPLADLTGGYAAWARVAQGGDAT